jgi:hypothetical protein
MPGFVEPAGGYERFGELRFHDQEPVGVGDFLGRDEVAEEREIRVRGGGDADRGLGDGEVFADAAGESSVVEVGWAEAL